MMKIVYCKGFNIEMSDDFTQLSIFKHGIVFISPINTI